MRRLTRRSLLRSSLGLVAAGSLAKPYIANAAATTATVWWVQGFIQEEDVAFKKIVADYEKASGNTIDYTIIPFAPMRQKIISAVTSGVVPDMYQSTPTELIGLQAWADKLVDVTDVINTQREEYTETALASAYCYNSVEKSAAFTASRSPKEFYRIMSGGPWSKRPATRWRIFRKPGMPIMISSRKCKKSCVPRGCAKSTA